MLKMHSLPVGHYLFKWFVFFLVSPLLLCCSAQKNISNSQTRLKSISALKFINEYSLPYNLQFQNVRVGGLSGIDYDKEDNSYYMICDDRSHHGPARFYKAKIAITTKGIDSVEITDMSILLQQDGSTYPELTPGATKTTDPEAMRYNPRTKLLTWTSEGDRVLNPGDTIIIDPTISMVTPNGKFADSIPLPDNLRMRTIDQGPRRNGVLEGLTFADNFKTLFVNMEEPLFEDGPQANLTDNNPLIRIYKFNLKSKKNTGQYAYKLNPIAFPSTEKDGDMNNGIPDILWIGNNKMIVTERSYSEGWGGTNIKVFLADLNEADNIIDVASLKENPSVRLIKKQLLLNMDDLGIYIDNIEGATFGPKLSNGHQSIIFVADNNFSKLEKAQFLLFEVIP